MDRTTAALAQRTREWPWGLLCYSIMSLACRTISQKPHSTGFSFQTSTPTPAFALSPFPYHSIYSLWTSHLGQLNSVPTAMLRSFEHVGGHTKDHLQAWELAPQTALPSQEQDTRVRTRPCTSVLQQQHHHCGWHLTSPPCQTRDHKLSSGKQSCFAFKKTGSVGADLSMSGDAENPAIRSVA